MMMATRIQHFSKDPDAKLDYAIDWSSWLAAGETITASAWTVATGITEVISSFNDTTTKIWLSGGTAGTTYTIANTITTSDGRIDERTFDVIVEER